MHSDATWERWKEAQLNSMAILAGKRKLRAGQVAELVGRRRDEHRRSNPKRTQYSAGHDIVGAAGEIAFAREFGYSVDNILRQGGDTADFITPVGKVDIKTARKAYALIVKKGSRVSNVVILAQYHEKSRTATLIGWEWGSIVKKAPIRRMRPELPENHFIVATELRPIDELKQLIEKERNSHET